MIRLVKDELFSMCLRVGEYGTVTVTEMPNEALKIEGSRIDDCMEAVITRGMYLSREAALNLYLILKKWKSVAEKERKE